jgi:hypothetical protein
VAEEVVVRVPKLRKSTSVGWLAVLLAGGIAAAAPASAVQLQLGLLPESAIVPEQGAEQPLTGALSLEIESDPMPTAVLRLLDVSVAAGPLSITLDPALATPGLGILHDDGSFLIPTLFLRVADGVAAFDLAVPNVAGFLHDLSGAPRLESVFEVDSGGPAGVLTVRIAAVPEPSALILLGVGIGALAGARKREVA